MITFSHVVEGIVVDPDLARLIETTPASERITMVRITMWWLAYRGIRNGDDPILPSLKLAKQIVDTVRPIGPMFPKV